MRALSRARADSMYTCCPHCQTCFRITKPQLDVAQGKVRCGHCQQVFNARQHLHSELPAANRPAANAPAAGSASEAVPAAPAPAPQDTAAEDEAPDFDLFDLESIPESKADESWLEELDHAPEAEEDREPTSILDASELQRSLAAEDAGLGEEDDILAGLDEEDEPESAYTLDDDYDGDVLAGLDDDEEDEDATSIIDMRPLQEKDLIPKDVIPVEAAAQGEETMPEPSAADQSSQYLYVDPEDLRHEEQQIDDIMAELDAQLETPAEPDPIPDSLAEGSAEAAHEASGRPADKDDFETSFLENLDAGLAVTPPVSEPEPPAPQAAAVSAPPPRQTDAFDDILSESTLRRQAQAAASDTSEIPARLRSTFVTESAPRRPLRWLAGLLLMLVLAAALLIQLVMFRSSTLLSLLPALQPLVSQLCTRLPCLYTGPVDISRIKLVSRDIRVHPQQKNALLISATFVNRAPFPQPYPDLTITLSDLSGEIVARRRFTPRDYLGREVSSLQLLPPDKPVQVTLAVVDPGKDAVNFEFTFQ